MKKLLLFLMMLAMAVPLWAGLQTVTIHRNEGQFSESNGVYYCYKSGLMMTFTSGMNNPNYLVEHQQVYFEVRSVNPEYIIKKIVFHCVDNTTSDNLDCFYWGPSTIHIVQNWTYPSQPGTYTYSGYTGTWRGTTNKIQFTTEAKPVRFGSVDITFEKETGDIFDLVTADSLLQAGHKYAIVNQYYPTNSEDEGYAMSTLMNDSYSTIGRTKVSFVPNTNKHKVIINDETRIITLQTGTNVSDRPWYLGSGSSTVKMRRASSQTGSATSAKGYTLSFENIGSYPEFFPVKIEIGAEADNYPARIRFCDNSANYNKPTDTNYAIGHNNTYEYFKVLDITSTNSYAATQRVHLYKPAQNYIITTERHPEDGGEITLTDGVLEINGNQTSQELENVSFYVSVNDGYTIQSVTATDANNNPVTIECTSQMLQGNSYKFTMPGANVHIVVNYAQANYHVIHTECDPTYGGEYTFNSGTYDMNDQVVSYNGNLVNFGITASLGYVFTGITATSDDGQSTVLQLTDNGDGTYSFVMPDNDVTLSATFDRVIGDIFELVTSGSQIVEGSTYIIVSQNHDVVMKHKSRSESTFQGAPIVEWPLGVDDKSKVRVDDNACFFRMDDLVLNTSNNYKSAYMNTLVGYIGYNGYDGTTGNVITTPDMSGYNRATMYISAAASGQNNYLCTFDSIKTANRTIRYEVGTNSFKIINYNNNSDERVWLYKLAESYHNISVICTPPEGGSVTTSASSAQENETVTFNVTTNDGYNFDGVTVTYTDGSAGTIPVTDNGDGSYSFTMPDNAVTINAEFSIIPVGYAITTECIPSNGGYFHVYVNNVNYYGSANAMPGENVAVWVGTNPGYRIASVTAENLTTGEAVTLTLDPNNSNDAGNTYDFTMPVGNVHITAKFYTPLFLLGTAMGRTNWCPSGPEFAFDAENDQYYLDVYFKGIRGVPGQNDDEYGYFSMAGAVAPVDWTNYGETYSDRWGEVQQRLAAENPNSDYNLVGDGSADVVLYNDRPDNAFKIKAGVYRIIVNHDKNRMSIVQYKPSIAFDPVSGSPVNMNDVVDITSNLQDTVHHIAARYGINEVAQKFRNTTDGGANWTSDENSGQNGAQAVISHTGTTTVVAEAWIGYITARDTAEYVLRGITYVVNPDAAGTVTGPTSSSPGTTVTVTPTASNGYYLDNVTATVTIDGVEQPVTLTDNGDGTYSFEMPDGDVTVTANFAAGYRIFTYCYPPEGGSINVASSAEYGDQVNFTVNRSPGYALTNLRIINETTGEIETHYLTDDIDYTFYFYMPASNVTIEATFEPGYDVTKRVVPNGNCVNTFDVWSETWYPMVRNTYCVGDRIYCELMPVYNYQIDSVTLTNETTGEVIVLECTDTIEVDVDQFHSPEIYYDYDFEMPASNVIITVYLSTIIDDTPLGFIERHDTYGSEEYVTVSDELIGTWMAKNYLWAKDQRPSNYFLNKTGEPIDFIRTKMKREVNEDGQKIDWQPEEWDQSNWVMLDFGRLPQFADWEYDPAVYQAMRETMQNYVDNRILEKTISGNYYCTGRPMEVLDEDFREVKCQHVIILDKLPEHGPLATSESESLGYPGYVEDPREWYHYSNPTSYKYNHYMSSNFDRNNSTSSGVAVSSDVIDDYANMGVTLNPNDRYFFMTPKDQEVAQVWGVWVGSRTFEFNGKTTTGDVFESYEYNLQDNVNTLGFSGSFYVPSWEFNRLDAPASNDPKYGKPGVDDEKEPLELNTAYIFHAAIKYMHVQDDVVSMPSVPLHAPVAPSTSTPNFYMVYPLDVMSSEGSATSVREIRQAASTEIDSIRYYNIMGQESETPFDGINIEVIRYKDGSSISKKILR